MPHRQSRHKRLFVHIAGEHGAIEIVRPTPIAYLPFLVLALLGSYSMRVVAPHSWWPLIVPSLIMLEAARRYFDSIIVLGRHRLLGIEGRLSLRIRKSVIRYSDMRAINVSQTLIARIFGFGTIEIATAGTGGVEVAMQGIAMPRLLAKYLEQRRRESNAEMHAQGVVQHHEDQH